MHRKFIFTFSFFIEHKIKLYTLRKLQGRRSGFDKLSQRIVFRRTGMPNRPLHGSQIYWNSSRGVSPNRTQHDKIINLTLREKLLT